MNKIYRIRMISGDCFYITQEEYNSLIISLNNSQTITIARLGATFNPKCTETIVDCENIDRSNLREGLLADGTKIVKERGTWRYALDSGRQVNPSDYPKDNEVFCSLEELKVSQHYLLK
jgi:hypothetical protein